MRVPRVAALLAAVVLALAACGGGDEAEPDASPGEETEVTEDDRGGELAADVAAVVNGEEIPTATIDTQVEAFATNPQIAEALQGENAEQARALLRAQVLSTAIVSVIALATAEELGVPVTEEDVAAARTQLEDEAGGADALAQTLAEEGISADQVDVQLEALAALRNIEEALAGQGETGGDDGAPAAGETAAQELLAERLAAADVVVNEDYGGWNPQTGQVMPPGGLPQAPAPQATEPTS